MNRSRSPPAIRMYQRNALTDRPVTVTGVEVVAVTLPGFCETDMKGPPCRNPPANCSRGCSSPRGRNAFSCMRPALRSSAPENADVSRLAGYRLVFDLYFNGTREDR